MIGWLPTGIRARLLRLPGPTRAAWKWDLATGAFAGVYQGCVWTFVARVARAELHATDSQMGWIAAAPAVGYLFATVWARQMDGRSKMPFVFWTWLFARGAFMLTPFMRQREQFVFLVCITPVVFSISAPAYTAIMKEIYPDRHRGRLMSAVRIGMSALTLAAALVMGRLLDGGLSWSVGFVIGGACGALSAITFSRIPLTARDGLDDRMPARDFFADTVNILRRNPGYRWFIASVFVSGFGNLMATALYPMYQVDRFHITNMQVAVLQNVGMAATLCGYFVWGAFLDRTGPLHTVLAALCFNLMAPLLYARGTTLASVYAAGAAMGMAGSGTDLAYVNTTLLFSERGKVSQYQAIHSSFFGVRGTIAPHFAIPLRRAVSWQPAFLLSAVVIFAGLGLQLVSMRDYRRQSRRAQVAVGS